MSLRSFYSAILVFASWGFTVGWNLKLCSAFNWDFRLYLKLSRAAGRALWLRGASSFIPQLGGARDHAPQLGKVTVQAPCLGQATGCVQ